MYGEKYYFEFYNVENHYRTEIHELNFSGAAQEIQAAADPVTMEIPEAVGKLEALHGTSLRLQLLEGIGFELTDLYTENEKQLIVIHKQNDEVIFRGYILPDGARKSFVTDVWAIELTAVDGIGLLKDLAFVDEAGLFFGGRMNLKDIIFHCLRRIGLPGMDIYTSVNTYYDGAFLDANTLELTYVNTERYLKDVEGGIEPMNCEEVLKSILETFPAAICQRRGDWFVYRANELYDQSASVTFFRYRGDTGNFIGGVQKTFDRALGSQIKGAYPHHANENQQIELQKAYKAFRVNYKFGLLKSLSPNEQFYNWTAGEPDGWDFVGSPAAVQVPRGLRFNEDFEVARFAQFEDPIEIAEGAQISIEVTVGHDGGDPVQGIFSIRLGLYYLRPNMEWGFGAFAFHTPIARDNKSATITVNAPPAPISGQLQVNLHGASEADDVSSYVIWERVRVYPSAVQATPLYGEFHTVEQVYDYSFIPENKIVYNGDNFDQNDIYVGSLYKDNGDLTQTWKRKAHLTDESKPLLRIMAEDYIRMYQRQYVKFSGGHFGFFDYLSIVTISGIVGKFMPLGLEFNFGSNTGQIVLTEIINEEVPRYEAGGDLGLTLPGTAYSVTDDYGTSIKPLIR